MKRLIVILGFLIAMSGVAWGQVVPPWKPKVQPTIRYVDQEVSKPYFEIKFDKGAVWSCVIFKQLTNGKGPDGKVETPPYEPRLCNELSEDMTQYFEYWDPIPNYVTGADWEVYASVGYTGPDGTQVQYQETNHIKVHQ